MDFKRPAVERYPPALDGLRYVSAWLLYLYALSKLAGFQFTLPPGTRERPVGSLTGFELTWYYFGYSHAYKMILGLTQLLGATLLLFRRTAALGAALLLPVLVNIVLINLFFVIALGAQLTSAFLLAAMLAILWHSRALIAQAFWSGQSAEPARTRKMHRIAAALVVASALAVILAGVVAAHGRAR
jgi:hypothetical protein